MDNDKYFTTSDLGLTAALMTSGISYKEAKKVSPKQVIFIFERTEYIDKAKGFYYSNALQVPASTYNNNIKSLHGIISGILKEGTDTKSKKRS